MNLEIQSLHAGYGANRVIDGVDFRVESGSITALLGPNGCGKSTLLKVIGRLLKPESGEVLLDGKSVWEFDTKELAGHLAVLPQLHHAPGETTVEELVEYGRYPRRKNGFVLSAHDRQVIDRVITMTSLETLRKRPVRTLSGGERQRTWIALTLAQEPEVLLLDEPTTFLDVCCQFEVIDLIRRLNRECGITVLMVLHDLNLAASCADRMLMLKDGGIRYAGTPQEVMKPDILEEIFRIRAEVIRLPGGTPHCIPTGSLRRG